MPRNLIAPPSESGTLNTRGYCNYDSRIAGPFTAHPKIDPVTGDMVFFGYNAGSPFSAAPSFGSVNASGVVTHFDRFEAPYASMVHDFIATENHLLFPILPIAGSMERARGGWPPYAWEPDKSAYVGVKKRSGAASDLVWFRAESCYFFHVMNAREYGEHIIADVMQFEGLPLFSRPDGSPTDPKKSRVRLCRCTFDLAGIPTASRKPILTMSRANSAAAESIGDPISRRLFDANCDRLNGDVWDNEAISADHADWLLTSEAAVRRQRRYLIS